MKSVYGYVRVSTLRQVKGHSLDYQREALEKFCKANDCRLAKVYVDKGISAVKERVELEKMFTKVLSSESIDGIITYTIARFGRSTQDLLFRIEQLHERGKIFISVKEQFDTSTKLGKLLLTMLAAIAEFERETILERMQAGREHAKLSGTKSGKPMHRPRVEIDWKKVDYYREHNISWRKIALLLRPPVSVPTIIKRARERGMEI